MEPAAGRLPRAHPASRSPGLSSGPRSQVDAGLPLRPGPGVGEDGGQRKCPGEGQSRGRELGALSQPPCAVGNSWETQRPAWKLPIWVVRGVC